MWLEAWELQLMHVESCGRGTEAADAWERNLEAAAEITNRGIFSNKKGHKLN